MEHLGRRWVKEWGGRIKNSFHGGVYDIYTTSTLQEQEIKFIALFYWINWNPFYNFSQNNA